MMHPPSCGVIESAPIDASGMLPQLSEDCQTLRTAYCPSGHVKSPPPPLVLKVSTERDLPTGEELKVLQAPSAYWFQIGLMNVSS